MFFFQGKGGSSLPVGGNAFAIENPQSIGSIHITSIKDGDEVSEVLLEKKGAEWILNENQTALAPKVDRLLKSIKQQRIRQPITVAGQKRAKEILDNHRLEVVIKDTVGKPLVSYDIGTQTQDSKGTVMRLQDDETFYVVAVPGVTGYLNTYYTPNSSDWLENVLFNTTPQAIAEVTISFRESGGKVRLARQNEGWKLYKNDQEQAVDQAKVETYLAMYDGKVYAESFASENFPTMADSLKNREADVVLSVKGNDGSEQALSLFVRADNRNNYFGFMKGDPTLRTVQTYVIDKYLMKGGL
ncbi:MAG: DUF4340 domain-containing protein [Bacteroidia bacterium]